MSIRRCTMTGQVRPPESASPVGPQAQRWLDLAAVEPSVLDLRPDYAALIIIADGLHPGPSDEATDALLSDAEAQARARWRAVRRRTSSRWPPGASPTRLSAPSRNAPGPASRR